MAKSNASDPASSSTPKRQKGSSATSSKSTSADRPSKKSKTSSSSSSVEGMAAAAAAITNTNTTPTTTPRKSSSVENNNTNNSNNTATNINNASTTKTPKKTDSRGDSLATILPKKKESSSSSKNNNSSNNNNNNARNSSSGTPINNAKSPKVGGEISAKPSAADRRKETKSPLAVTTTTTTTITSTTNPSTNNNTTPPSKSKNIENEEEERSSGNEEDEDNNNNKDSNKNPKTTEQEQEDESSSSSSRPPTTDNNNNTEDATGTAGADDDDEEEEEEEGETNQPKKKKGRPPKIETATNEDNNSSNPTTAGTATTTPSGKSPGTGSAQDQHPYARSSVIEVWHGVEDPSEDSWWTEDSDSDEETITTTHRFKTKQGKQASVRLCDVIDRVPVGSSASGKWRYYVHYRDFNRRMDEWVSMERIVSPPSVGNAKARAIKLEEEKQKRKQAREEEKKAEVAIDVSAPRASRRRSVGQSNSTPTADATATMATMTTTTPTSMASVGETPRQTRKQRRKSMDDDATVVMGNNQESGRGGTTPVGDHHGPPAIVMAAEKGIVALPTEAVHVTSVGEHVVETIAAQELDEHEGLDEASLREHEEVTKVKNVAFIELGSFQMETWYFSPLPKELLSERGLIEVLYVCEFTLNMFSRKSELRRFQSRLPTHARHPPGNEIYRNGNIAMFEVDGFEERIYCQNLCYIAKLFLDHKTLYFDVDPFLFYVLCEVDERGFHPVGYYSKEKYSDVGYNLACILTFPCHQRKGYGRFLIAFSYELSKKEEKVGSPEKPMSDLGQQAYKPYWASTIVDFLLTQAPDASSMSIMDISKITSIMAEDIVFTLNQLGILKIISGVYFVAAEKGLLQTLAKKYPVKEPRVDASKLHWSPFVTDVKRDKFSIHSKKPSVEGDEMRGSGGF